MMSIFCLIVKKLIPLDYCSENPVPVSRSPAISVSLFLLEMTELRDGPSFGEFEPD